MHAKRPKLSTLSASNKPVQMNSLSDDNLKKIFELLPAKNRFSLELVCHRWGDLAKQSWSNYTVLNSEDSTFFKSKSGAQVENFVENTAHIFVTPL
uniref:F-box domain-containing protein n=1 Tax=Ditylenchus dipsaci TaxID=166011 RepID=A0A915EKP7_9BILA